MRYLITGGCGFLGSNIGAKILESQHELMVLDNLSRLGANQNLEWLEIKGRFKFIHGDVRNQDDINRAFKLFSPDVIFHLAGQVAMTTSLERPRFDFEINALGTLNVLEAIRNYSPNASIIYSSTNKVYGDLQHLKFKEMETRYELADFPNGIPENFGLDFHSPYGCSKGSADQYILDYARMFNIKGVVFRHSSMYGGRQFSTFDQGWVGWFCQKAVEQSKGSSEIFTVSGNGKQVRDLLHAEDMVDLYLRAADLIDSIYGNAFNIGGGVSNSLSILELLDYLGKLIESPLKFQHIAPRESDQLVFIADLKKARELLDWAPKTGWRIGVKKMVDWCKSLEDGKTVHISG
jgi:CDP-paratose 2-epimerase